MARHSLYVAQHSLYKAQQCKRTGKPMELLPAELKCEIFKYLTDEDKFKLATLCNNSINNALLVNASFKCTSMRQFADFYYVFKLVKCGLYLYRTRDKLAKIYVRDLNLCIEESIVSILNKPLSYTSIYDTRLILNFLNRFEEYYIPISEDVELFQKWGSIIYTLQRKTDSILVDGEEFNKTDVNCYSSGHLHVFLGIDYFIVYTSTCEGILISLRGQLWVRVPGNFGIYTFPKFVFKAYKCKKLNTVSSSQVFSKRKKLILKTISKLM